MCVVHAYTDLQYDFIVRVFVFVLYMYDCVTGTCSTNKWKKRNSSAVLKYKKKWFDSGDCDDDALFIYFCRQTDLALHHAWARTTVFFKRIYLIIWMYPVRCIYVHDESVAALYVCRRPISFINNVRSVRTLFSRIFKIIQLNDCVNCLWWSRA